MPQSWYEGFPIKRIGLRPYLVVWGNILRAFHCPVFDRVRYCQKLHSGKGGEQSDTYIYRNVDEFNTMYHVGNANLPVSLGVWQRANKHVSQCCWSRSLYRRQAHWEWGGAGDTSLGPPNLFWERDPTRLFILPFWVASSFLSHCIVWTQWVNAWVE